jgi:transcriptional regulator with XRE-family HTH domain
MEIGCKIKELREYKGYSIREFAKLCELSPSLVSQVERDIASPSLSSLVKMAEVLGCPVGYFFGEQEAGQVIVRQGDRRKLVLPDHTLTYELATPSESDGEVRMLIVTLEPGQYSSDRKISHQDKEICFVLEGEVKVEFEQISHLLTQGDTITFDSQDPHRFFNHTHLGVRMMLIIYKRGDIR